jgi:hypothetical protein
MGAYNSVTIPWSGAEGEELLLTVQFKYGDTWQHKYELGDELRWGGNDVGRRTAGRVVVDGALEGQPPVAGIPDDFEVHIVANRIVSVVPASGQYDFTVRNEPYITLDAGDS